MGSGGIKGAICSLQGSSACHNNSRLHALFFLSLHLSLSFPLSCFMSVVNCVLMFMQTCDGASTLSSPNTVESCPFTHTHTHTHTHTNAVVSSNIHQTCCHLTNTQECMLFCIHPYSISLLSCYYLSHRFPIGFILLYFFHNP